MSVGDVYSLSLDQLVHSVGASNVFYYEQTADSAAGDDDAAEILQAFLDTNLAAWASALSEDWMAICVRGRLVSGSGGSERVGVLTVGNVGLRLFPALPCNQVGIVTTYTDTFTKKGRGRKFISGLLMDDEVDNALNATGFSNLSDIADTFLVDITATVPNGTWKPVLWDEALSVATDIERFLARPGMRKLRSRTSPFCVAT